MISMESAMHRIKGITVTLYSRTDTGKRDAFNHPVYEEKAEEIENVLVSPITSEDILSNTSLDGHKASYTLGIPKMDNHSWENAIVGFFGKRWHVIGIPQEGISENIPLSWNKKVTVEAYE